MTFQTYLTTSLQLNNGTTKHQRTNPAFRADSYGRADSIRVATNAEANGIIPKTNTTDLEHKGTAHHVNASPSGHVKGRRATENAFELQRSRNPIPTG